MGFSPRRPYALENNTTAAAPADVYNNAILPRAAALDTSKMTYSVTWNANNHPYSTAIVNNQVVAVPNTVQVTVNYQWIPGVFHVAPITLTSTSVAPMCY